MNNPKEEHSGQSLSETLKSNGIAFSNSEVLKSSISKQEFESVIDLLEHSYTRMSKLLSDRSGARSEAKERLQGLKDSGMPTFMFSKAVKVTKSLLHATDKKMYANCGKEIDNINNVTSFLNIFRAHDDLLESLDFSFINKIKEEI